MVEQNNPHSRDTMGAVPLFCFPWSLEVNLQVYDGPMNFAMEDLNQSLSGGPEVG